MELQKIKMYDKIEFDATSKGTKYSMQLDDNTKIKFNRGRALEFSLQKFYNYDTIELENVSHKKAGDIEIAGKQWNIKSYKCELRADGNSLEEKIDKYIEEDASCGLIYIVEIDNELIAIKMLWQQAREFIRTFGAVETTGKSIRIRTCDKKIYQWALLHK